MGPKLLAAFNKASTSVAVCGVGKLRKRQSCGMSQFINDFVNNFPIQEIDAQLSQLPGNSRFWNPNDINAIIRALRAGGALTGAAITEAGLPVAGVALAVYMYDYLYDPSEKPKDGGGGHKVPEVVNINIAPNTQSKTDTEGVRCPKEPVNCWDKECKGTRGENDSKCTLENELKNCPCEVGFTSIPNYAIPGMMAAYQAPLNVKEEDAVCDTGHGLDVDEKFWTSLMAACCKDFKAMNPGNRDLTNKDATGGQDWSKYDKWKFMFQWKDPKSDCAMSCEDIYKSFSAPPCKPFPDSFPLWGSRKLACGTTSYNISEYHQVETKPLDKNLIDKPKCGESSKLVKTSDIDKHITDFCNTGWKEKWTFGANTPRTFNPLAAGGGIISMGFSEGVQLQISANQAFCAPGNTMSIRFDIPGVFDRATCKKTFQKIYTCPEDTKKDGKTPGGMIYKDCIQWTKDLV
ncbi:hypothetical protein EJ08DRAFT_697656 [Tothia fuscella]|uniref:Uncharacterized protein n=1 Tax=Tothia fuscella TaxID=1048955 RepID=A0A9P4NR29_9PEZI|nr:hypothetical protein EJ08DRAFT_697656 [Tothia fuscella]